MDASDDLFDFKRAGRGFFGEPKIEEYQGFTRFLCFQQSNSASAGNCKYHFIQHQPLPPHQWPTVTVDPRDTFFDRSPSWNVYL